MEFQLVKGAGRLTTNKPDVVLPAMYETPVVADFYAEFDVRTPAAEETSSYGLIFRSDDTDGGLAWFYSLGLMPATNEISFNVWQDADWVVSESYPLPEDLLTRNRYNHARLEAIGEDLRVFVNDAFIFERSDDTLGEPGLLGVFIGSSETLRKDGEELAYFDNLRVYAPAAPAAEAEILLQDDFSDPESGWETGKDKNGVVRYQDGALHIRNYTDAKYRADSRPALVAGDVVIEVKSWLVDGTPNNWQTVFCRSGKGEDNEFAFSYSADGYYHATLWVDGEAVRKAEVALSDNLLQGVDAVNAVRVSCVGSQFHAWVNDVLLVEWEDDRLPNAGEFGVGVSALDAEFSEAAFDDFVAYNGEAATPEPTATEEAAGLEAEVIVRTLGIRAGPGTSYARAGMLRQGERYPAVGRDERCTWLQLSTSAGDGWVNADYVRLSGTCEQLPVSP